jgi:hypothetical protein
VHFVRYQNNKETNMFLSFMKPFGSPHRSDYIPSKQTAANIGATKSICSKRAKGMDCQGRPIKLPAHCDVYGRFSAQDKQYRQWQGGGCGSSPNASHLTIATKS